MEKILKFSFVSHYYNNQFEFISRMIEFIKDYYSGVFRPHPDKLNKISLTKIPKKRIEGEVLFGEIVPIIFEPHTLVYKLNDFKDENLLLDLLIKETSLLQLELKEMEECINVIFYHYVGNITN